MSFSSPISGLLKAVFVCIVLFSVPIDAQVTASKSMPEVNTDIPGVDPKAILLSVSEAVKRLNYEATLVVYRPNTEPVPYVWRHGVNDQESMEYLNELNGPGSQIIRFGNKVSYFESDMPAFTLKQSHIHGPLPHNLIRDPQRIFAAYDVVFVGRSRVTGKSALQFRIVSKDNSRYTYAYWVDEESFLPLKLNTLTLKGEVLEQVQVTNLTIKPSVHDDFLAVDTASLPDVKHINPRKEFSLNWGISQLPIGMLEQKRQVHRLAITGELVEYMLLSDGLVDVSIYLQKAGSVAQDDVLLRNQAETLLSRVRDGLQLTVIGKIPAPTANKLMELISTTP